ncbi:MAG: AraC family transcriptional regulator [Bryobacterales bacterium]|nr:AraC family transcriptional regulator [Bryobacterales bacterium]
MSIGLANRALWPLLDGLRALGHDADAILARTGIAPRSLDNPDRRVPNSAAIQFWNTAVSITGDRNLGLHLAESASWESFDLHPYLMAASATLGDAYRRLCIYQRLIHDETRVELVERGEHAVLRHSFVAGGSAPRQAAEFLIAAWLRVGRHITPVIWHPTAVHFAHPSPGCLDDHARILQAPIRFDAGENALLFPASLLATPCRAADPGLLAVLSRHAGRVLSSLPAIETTGGRVRAALGDCARKDAATVARELGLSVRTMQRRLRSEGTSFAVLSESVRRRCADEMLLRPQLSLAQIAEALGYADVTAFHRWFTQISGMSPSVFRKCRKLPSA